MATLTKTSTQGNETLYQMYAQHQPLLLSYNYLHIFSSVTSGKRWIFTSKMHWKFQSASVLGIQMQRMLNNAHPHHRLRRELLSVYSMDEWDPSHDCICSNWSVIRTGLSPTSQCFHPLWLRVWPEVLIKHSSVGVVVTVRSCPIPSRLICAEACESILSQRPTYVFTPWLRVCH